MSDDSFDSLAHDNRTTVRALHIEHFPDGKVGYAPGHEFHVGFDVGPNTRYVVHANAQELRRWSRILASAVTRLAPDWRCSECWRPFDQLYSNGTIPLHLIGDAEECPGSYEPPKPPECPTCEGSVHIDLSREIFSTSEKEGEL